MGFAYKISDSFKNSSGQIGKYSEDYIPGAAGESTNQCNFSGEEFAKCIKSFKTVYLLA